jgi:UDP-N-acetylmuramoyl-L-alanyl-D-glutamate--2,6-diaminopimelate ligase
LTAVDLAEVAADLDVLAVAGAAGLDGVDVGGIAYDSRQVVPGDLFCCLPGAHTDGHDHAEAAVAAGAVALLVERPLPLVVAQVQVPDARRAMALASAAFFGHPSRAMQVVGVTGTNGKTTTVHLLAAAFEAAGRSARVLGTLSGARTTPEAPDLQRQLAAWRDEGVEVVAMEVSSHALSLSRVDGTRFAAAVFTNLSRDHLDFHQTMESYFTTKSRLFDPAFTDLAVVNLDSPYGRLLRDTATTRTVGYGLDLAADLEVGAGRSTFSWRGQHVELGLSGRFNVANALAAAETAVALGLDPAPVAAGLGAVGPVAGRFELVEEGQPFTVVVDYAHTPDGLEQVLVAAGEIAGGGQVTAVFGCGGDRDPSKRGPMGQVAAERADRVVLTADNSRHEETGAIIDAVQQGFERADLRRATELVVEPDRRAAIAAALAAARPGDVVVVAGKGHEDTLVIGDDVVPFDDREVVRDELARLGGGAP